MEPNKPDFRNYDNPEEAQDIWNSYQERLEKKSLIPTAICIAGDNEFADDLNLKLDDLLKVNSKKKRRPSGLNLDGVF